MDEPIGRPWLRRHAVTIAKASGLLALAGVVALSVRYGAAASLRLPRNEVVVETVTRGLFHDLTSLQGEVTPHDIIYLDALEGGRVEQVFVQSGDRIVAGQPLVRFGNTQLELDILAQEGRLIESITQLQAYQQQLEQTRRDNDRALAQIDYDQVRLQRALDRRKPLAERGFVPRETMDQLEDELHTTLEQRAIQTARSHRQEGLRVRQQPQIDAQLETLNRSLAITRAKLDDLTVRAPATGRVTAFDLKIGENRNRGDRLGAVILDTGFRIGARIDEFYLDRVRVGQRATVEVHGQTAALKVTRIYPQVKDGTFAVDLEFIGAQPTGLVAGEAVRGTLTLGADKPGLVLPAGAFLEQSGGNWAFVLDMKGAHAVKRPIRIGRRNAEQVEILSGLVPGNKVITSSYTGWDAIERIDLTSQ
ncbi:MAG TPA: HlyD family efflux transporter periplasmic adaptor subunit [Sphingobium sp.]|nr:HlyD family efflux transporter periplasmic adaptor subunit [Sphingobium sp.]